MKNRFPLLLVLVATVIVSTTSCSKQTAPAPSTDYSFTEEFDTVSKAVAKGWVISNNSKPLGTVSWMQGFFYVSLYHGFTPGKTGGPFNYASSNGFGGNNPSYSGADFIMTTSECGAGVANLSNWLISPEVIVKNGDQVTFYSRTYANPAVGADKLEVRVNTLNSSADVGKDSNSVGGFKQVILTINKDLLLQGAGSYPEAWTKYTATISGMPVAKKSRIALRYYVTNGGPQGPNSLGIGVDKFQFVSY